MLHPEDKAVPCVISEILSIRFPTLLAYLVNPPDPQHPPQPCCTLYLADKVVEIVALQI